MPARAHEKEIPFASVVPAQKAPKKHARGGRCPTRTSSSNNARPTSGGRTKQTQTSTRETRRPRAPEEGRTGCDGRDESPAPPETGEPPPAKNGGENGPAVKPQHPPPT